MLKKKINMMEVVYSLCYQDIQEEALEYLGRELTNKELEGLAIL